MAATEDDDAAVFEIERILADSEVDGEKFFLVKWEGYDDEQCTWEPAKNFSSLQSIDQYNEQKAKGLNLPDEFLALLQQRMDDFEHRINQSARSLYVPDGRDDSSGSDRAMSSPRKRQKIKSITDITLASDTVPQGTEISRNKGIVIHTKPSSLRPNKQTLVQSANATRMADCSGAPLLSSTTNKKRKNMERAAYQMSSVFKAGQKFRNLSHQNNYRKKLGQEPEPVLAPQKLKTVADFNIGRDNIHALIPITNHTQQNNDNSPLFFPDAHGDAHQKTVSPAPSDSVTFPPAKVDHSQLVSNIECAPTENMPVAKPVGSLPTISKPRLNGTSNNKFGDDSTSRESEAFPRRQPSQAKDNTGRLPQSMLRQANIPPTSDLRYAKNGRTWYKGDLMCNLTMGESIGDATIIHIPWTLGSEIVKLKDGDILRLDFEKHSFSRDEFRKAFANHYATPLAIGPISPYEDTQPMYDDLAKHLEDHDSVAVFHHPDVRSNISLLLYSIYAPSWKFLGWKLARVGQPRLHIAFLPRLIERYARKSLPAADRMSMATLAQQENAKSDYQTHDSPPPLRRRRTDSFNQKLHLCSDPISVTTDLKRYLDERQIVTTSMADPPRHLSEDPLLDSTSCETSPSKTTSTSPQLMQPTTKDRRRRQSTSIIATPRMGKVRRRYTKALDGYQELHYQTLITSHPSHSNTKFDAQKAQFFISFSSIQPVESKLIQTWLEKYFAPSNIYLDSERHGWARFQENASKPMSVIFFSDTQPNYHKLEELGGLMGYDSPICFSLNFGDKDSDLDLKNVKMKKLFPRMSAYLITESMIVNKLDDTVSMLRYFESNKKPGYKVMMPPNIERWLLEHAAREKNPAQQDKLIDLLVSIRTLGITTDTPPGTDENDIMGYLPTTTNGLRSSSKTTYIITPSSIPGYAEAEPANLNSSRSPNYRSSFHQRSRDEILKSFFVAYAATKVNQIRRFFAFYSQEEAEEHIATTKQKLKDNTFDHGHVWFWELEKFVNKYCHNAEPSEHQGNATVTKKGSEPSEKPTRSAKLEQNRAQASA